MIIKTNLKEFYNYLYLTGIYYSTVFNWPLVSKLYLRVPLFGKGHLPRYGDMYLLNKNYAIFSFLNN
jgi:hypothetical protein